MLSSTTEYTLIFIKIFSKMVFTIFSHIIAFRVGSYVSKTNWGSSGSRRPGSPGSLQPLFPSLSCRGRPNISPRTFVVGGQAFRIQSRSLKTKRGNWESRTTRTSTSCGSLAIICVGVSLFMYVPLLLVTILWFWDAFFGYIHVDDKALSITIQKM